MQNITLKDLELIEVGAITAKEKKWIPKFIRKFVYGKDWICGYSSEWVEKYINDGGLGTYTEVYNEQGLVVYCESPTGDFVKVEDGKEIEYKNGKYYIDGKEAKLKK